QCFKEWQTALLAIRFFRLLDTAELAAGRTLCVIWVCAAANGFFREKAQVRLQLFVELSFPSTPE
ncbi:MAG TPA: hypothetical protein VNY81_02590, partial [Candidatus Saccharimonadales bacterium]|nr:hypothetical protein [Candidatus Saccharimonadales bacterium]